MTSAGGIFIAASGNQAFVTITRIGGRVAASIDWEQMPPSEQDRIGVEAAIEAALEAETGERHYNAGSKLYTRKEEREREREQREWLGGGKG